MSCGDVVKGSKTTFILLSEIRNFILDFISPKISGCGTRRPFSCGRPGEALELCSGYPHCAHAGHFYNITEVFTFLQKENLLKNLSLYWPSLPDQNLLGPAFLAWCGVLLCLHLKNSWRKFGILWKNNFPFKSRVQGFGNFLLANFVAGCSVQATHFQAVCLWLTSTCLSKGVGCHWWKGAHPKSLQ